MPSNIVFATALIRFANFLPGVFAQILPKESTNTNKCFLIFRARSSSSLAQRLLDYPIKFRIVFCQIIDLSPDGVQ
jgi:hypothetical protein